VHEDGSALAVGLLLPRHRRGEEPQVQPPGGDPAYQNLERCGGGLGARGDGAPDGETEEKDGGQGGPGPGQTAYPFRSK
jgi:hypothetical protein